MKRGKGLEQPFFWRRYTNGKQAQVNICNIISPSGNANQSDFIPNMTMAAINEMNSSSVAEVSKDSECSCILVELSHGAATVENSLPVPQKVKHRVTMWASAVPPLSISQRELQIHSHTKTCMWIFRKITHNHQKGRINIKVHQPMNG